MSESVTYITMTQEELDYAIEQSVTKALAKLGVKGNPAQSGRIYRQQMIEIVGRRAYEEALEKGWLIIQKHDPEKSNSRVYARRSDWERFIQLHTNQKI